MSTTWKINGSTFADGGLSNVTRQTNNMAADRLTFDASGRAIDANPLFDYDAPVIVYRNATPFFAGRGGRVKISGSGQSESHAYEVFGPWEQMERTTFQQRWKSGRWVGEGDAAEWVPEWAYKSRVVLGQGEDGLALSVGQVVSEVISYASSCGIAIAPGVIEAGPYFPWDQALDMSCAEIIRRVTRYCPESIGYVDYSTATPTFNFRRRAGLSVISLAVGRDIATIDLTKQGARSVPAVVIKYEQQTQVDGAIQEAVFVDAFPLGSVGREIGAVVQTIQLSGGSRMTQRHHIVSKPMPSTSDPTSPQLLTWFLSKVTGYAAQNDPTKVAAEYDSFSIARCSHLGTTFLPYELVEGSLQDWMRRYLPDPADPDKMVENHNRSYSKLDQDEVIVFEVSYVRKNANGLVDREVTSEKISLTVRTTDCKTGYYSYSTSTPGESIPAGIAAALYENLNALHYQGSVMIVDEEVSERVWLGNRVVITGGAAEWARMSASVQSVADHIDSGSTTITVGPPDHLTPSMMLELRRCNRIRTPAGLAGVRISGLSSAAGSVELGSALPKTLISSVPGSWGQRCTFMTDIRFNNTTNCFEKKTMTAVCNYADGESGWTDVEGGCGEDCGSVSTGGT